MKPPKILKISMLLAMMAATPFAGMAQTSPAPVTAAAVLPNMRLSGPSHEIVRMVSSGVSEDVIKAYVESTPALFNLSADNIISLQSTGVSSGLLTEMLNHDKNVRDNSNAYATTPMPQPPQTMQPTAQPPDQAVDQGYASADDSDYYGALAPYGNWNYLPGYGWGWQPYSGLAVDYYPWGVLGFGGWFNCAGRGWCWFPGSRFNNFNRFGGFAGNRFGGRFDGRFNGGVHNGFRGGVGFNRGIGVNRGFAVNRSAAGFRGFSPAMGHFSGSSAARFGGGHSSFGGGSGGGHSFGGGGGMHGGGGGGHR